MVGEHAVTVWPLWVSIGFTIFGVIVRIAMIGKETKVKHTATGAVASLVASSVWIWYMVEVIKHLC